MHSNYLNNSILKFFLGAVLLIALAACRPPEDPMMGLMDAGAFKTRSSDLSRTIDFAFSERQFPIQEFEQRVSMGLNRWSTWAKDDLSSAAYTPDPLAEPLLDANAELPVVELRDKLSFTATDATYVQQAVWLGQIAKRVDENTTLKQLELIRLTAENEANEDESLDGVTDAIESLNPDLSADEAGTLATATELFDWVTRNIQLIETIEPSANDVADQRLNDAESVPAAGVRGPGYSRFIWQTIVYGRGDFIDRAKVFIALCRQLDIDAVMIATNAKDGDDGEADSKDPWAVGVAIGDDYFLFDTRLGLPIPGKTPGSIATLAAAANDAEILNALDLTVDESLADDTDYWVKSEDLKKAAALVYFTPEGVSRRMAGLEGSLLGDQRLRLIDRPSDQIDRLPKPVSLTIKPWDIAFQTHQFRQAIREAVPKATTDDRLRQRLEWQVDNEDYVDAFANYRTGRARFIKGRFQDEPDVRTRDAISSYAILMYDENTIASLGTDAQLQVQSGVRQSKDMPAAEFQQRLRSVQHQMRMVSRDAGLFLTQSHFDNGSVSTAANWLPKLIDRDDTDRWKTGLHYLYGRSLEAQHDYDRAIEQYKKPGNQSHGNLIRVRQLKEQIEKL